MTERIALMPAKVLCVVGARPNFMKSAPLMAELRRYPNQIKPLLVHTGQHYDRELSQLLFQDLGMSEPDVFLGVGSATHAQQCAKIMVALEKVMQDEKPDLVVVFGDINSTMAAAIVAAKLWIKIAHVEAGLRSFDNRMPEEINRVVTDRLSDLLFASEESGVRNLRDEGADEAKIFMTGNIMIDSLITNLDIARRSDILTRLSLTPRKYVAMTLHRPSNVDDRKALAELLGVINRIGNRIPVVFPCHPRTRKQLEQFGLMDTIDNTALRLVEPLGYLDFLRLQSECKFVLTDSGGIQEETTYLGIPCITLRDSTERPATVDIGTNTITGTDPEKVLGAVNQILDGNTRKGSIPELWDGKTAERIVQIILEKIS